MMHGSMRNPLLLGSDEASVGRRVAPRMALSLPGKLIAVHANHTCIVTSLSRTGVLMAIRDPLDIGEQGYLRCGPIDHFVSVVRKENGINALQFDIPVSDSFVFAIRQFQEQFAALELDELASTARDWAQGSADQSSW